MQNGRFRKVKITIDAPSDASLSYREGYYANKEFKKFTSNDKEDQLQQALMLGDPVTDLDMQGEIRGLQRSLVRRLLDRHRQRRR